MIMLIIIDVVDVIDAYDDDARTSRFAIQIHAIIFKIECIHNFVLIVQYHHLRIKPSNDCFT